MTNDKPEQVKTIYAFLVTDDDGREKIVAMEKGSGWLQFVGVDDDYIKNCRPMALKLASHIGKTVRLCEFSVRKELEVFEAE